MNKRARELTKLARQFDREIKRTGSGHYALVGSGKPTVIASATTSNRGETKILLSELRRGEK